MSVYQLVSIALSEDIGSGDITANIIPSGTEATATIFSRENAIFCGKEWASEVFNQVDPKLKLEWLVDDGDSIKIEQKLAKLEGDARSLLTAERTALNFLQTLSGTATKTAAFVAKLKDTQTQLLDTRKTIPGFREAQKYAVKCGGGKNHRMGLFDAFLIKENHISACGSIEAAILKAREIKPDLPVEIEVENLKELEQAITANADIVLLDNFTLGSLTKAVILNDGKVKLEASGNVNIDNIHEIASSGVDYISVGEITKCVTAVDLSMLIDQHA